MCRLFGMHTGRAVTATFWLLDAPDSLARQSRANPDGAGIGGFRADGSAVLDKQPIAAWSDAEFATTARDLTSTTFIAHVRHASTGGHTTQNTHPFLQDGRLFAHNGVLGGLERLDARLAELGTADLVQGQTDSERYFALVTAEIRRHGGDIGAGLVAAVTWIAAQLPVFALNMLLSTPSEVWALRYPVGNELWLLERSADDGPLDARTDRIHTRAAGADGARSVVLASEPMDGEIGWRALDSGELLHVAADLSVTTSVVFPHDPTHLLTLADLGAAADSQR